MNKYNRLSLRKRIGLEYQRNIQRMLTNEHPLYQLFWECTLRCNLFCKHCGSDCRQQSSVNDMPIHDFLSVLDSVARRYNPHDVFVIISGGEPLMRDDLEECGRKIYEKGFPWGIVTNGMLLDRNRFRKLRNSGLHSVSLSIDGLCDAHNWMRGHNESFNRASEAIDIMAKEKLFAFDIVTCVTQRNIDILPQMHDFLLAKGVRMWRLISVFPSGRAKNNSLLHLSPSQLRHLMDFIKSYRQTSDMHIEYGCEGFLGNYEFDVRDEAFFCKAGVTVGSVLIDGSISACTSIRSNYHQGNIYKDDFIDVWENRFNVFRNHEWKRKGICSDCKVWRYCCGNGMHLRDNDGQITQCLYEEMKLDK